MKNTQRFIRWLAFLMVAMMVVGAIGSAMAKQKTITLYTAQYPVEEEGSYSSMEEVAVYLYLYNKLPDNFISKDEARELGWNNREGNLDLVAPGCSIGGDHFGNYEKQVPEKKGRKWQECDINFDGGYRNGERIVFSNDGLIYYSDDHYASFTKIKVKDGEKK